MLRRSVLAVFCVLIVGPAWSALAGLDPSLIAWWSLNEGAGTVAADSSGRGMHGVLVNDPLWREDGRHKGCLFFDGDDAYVQVAHQDILNPGTGSFTVAFWASVEVTPGTSGDTTWDLPVAKRDSGSVGYYVGASRGQGSGDQTGYRFMLGDTSANRKDTPFLPVPLDEWVFVTAVLDRAQNAQKISVDGGQTWVATTPPPGPIAPAQDFGIGWDIGQNNYWHHGRIDDVQIYDRALLDAEVVKIMAGLADPAVAQSPSPADEATDIARDVVLEWEAGEFAATHDVYLGTAFDDVNDGVGTLVSEGQAATSLDPDGLIEYGQTYYWRVDEVNAAPDNTIFKGEVWSFTIEPFAYPVQNIIATSSGTSDASVGPERTVDGSGLNAADEHSVTSTDMWLAVPGAEPLSIQYELDGVYKLHEMLVWNYNVQFELMLGFGLKDVTVEYSENGTDWTVLGDVELAQAAAASTYAANTTIAFNGVAAKYVRLVVNSGYGPLGQFGLSEVRFLYVPAMAREPQPEDGAADVSVDAVLGWRVGREAVSHEVSLGTDPEALALVDTTTGTSHAPAALDLAMTYYWKVDEVNEAEAIPVWEGHVWSFATQDYLVVDDFESYNDEDNVIYESWIDGWVNETGSTVGYLSAPFAETTIVNSGSQSMPLSYDNAGVATAEAELELGQNWTASGIQSLSLYFYGDPGNSGGQLYVKIDGTKIAYDGSAVNLTRATWHLWNIDLAASGASLSNVSSLTVGIEGSGATGIVYIDDIRLYPEVLGYHKFPDITAAGDTVVGVPNDDDWPAAESPDLAIDDDVNTKFLHRQGGAMATGIQVTPAAGATVVTGLTLTTANDASDRDPITFELSGSNAGISGPYELIAAGDIVDLAGEADWPRFTKNATLIKFDNTVAYAHYQIVFPTLRGESEALMQIAEVELIGEAP